MSQATHGRWELLRRFWWRNGIRVHDFTAGSCNSFMHETSLLSLLWRVYILGLM
jgi:hypothetical protein